METKLSPQEQEERFQFALKHWREHNDSKSWEEIWLRVYEACKANAKKMLKVSLEDEVFHERLMTVVETVIRYIKFGNRNSGPVNPDKLITYCHLPVVGAFFGIRAVKEDNELSYEQSVENGYDIATNILGERIDTI